MRQGKHLRVTRNSRLFGERACDRFCQTVHCTLSVEQTIEHAIDICGYLNVPSFVVARGRGLSKTGGRVR